MAYTAKDPCPPHHFLYLTETKSWKWEGGGEGEKGKGGGGEKVSLKTHTTARGLGKNVMKGKEGERGGPAWVWSSDDWYSKKHSLQLGLRGGFRPFRGSLTL